MSGATQRRRPRRAPNACLAAPVLALVASCGSPASSDEGRTSFRVTASRPATLVYALDAVAGRPRQWPGYEDWLFGPVILEPGWLADFRAVRVSLPDAVDQGRGLLEPYLEASYLARDRADLEERLAALLPPAEWTSVREALAQTDRALDPHWPRLAAELERAAASLEQLLAGEPGRRLIAELHQAAGLPAGSLEGQVVLVARPPGTQNFAHHRGGHLVLEWCEGQDPRYLAELLFHEMAHLAVTQSGRGDRVEEAFRGHGLRGTVAANYWNEALATAFGQGHASTELGEVQRGGTSWYEVPAIDALARHLERRWREGRPVRLDESLAQELLAGAEEAWGPERWTLGDVFFRHASFGGNRELLTRFARRLEAAFARGQSPLPERLAPIPDVPATLPRVFLLTLPELDQRTALVRELGLSGEQLRFQLSRAPAAWHLGLDSADVPWLLVAARTAEDLDTAVAGLLPSLPLPGPGWFRP